MDSTYAPVDMNNNHFWSPGLLPNPTKTARRGTQDKLGGYDCIVADTKGIARPSNKREDLIRLIGRPQIPVRFDISNPMGNRVEDAEDFPTIEESLACMISKRVAVEGNKDHNGVSSLDDEITVLRNGSGSTGNQSTAVAGD
jgi:hypothetical protein